MDEFPVVRVAAIQAAPAILDAPACIDQAVEWIGRAAADGAKLIVFPELFVPLYPSGSWAHRAARFDGFDDLWKRLWANSVDVPGPLLDRLVQSCLAHDVYVVMGVNERESSRSGSLYNTVVYLGPHGILAKHRKLMPTMHERLFHGIGRGDDLASVQTPVGRVGGLICWENLMPMARYAVYTSGPQIWVAPTADDSDKWLASMRHIAFESGAFVVSVPQFIPRSAFPDDFPIELPDTEVLGRGGAAIVEPTQGNLIAGPLYDEEGILTADCDLSACLSAKRVFDSVGHYAREDVLLSAVTLGAEADGRGTARKPLEGELPG